MGGMNAKNGPNFRIVGGRMRCGFLRFGGLGAQGLGFRYRFFFARNPEPIGLEVPRIQ